MHRCLTLTFGVSVICFGLILAIHAQPETLSSDFFQSIQNRLVLLIQDSNLNEHEQQLLEAMLLGYKANLSPELKAAFNAAGISHLLALSGMHIGALTLLVHWLIPKRIPKRSLVLIAFIWSYILLVGMPVSAVRAGLMTTLWLLNPYKGQHTFTLDTVALSAMILLIYNPLYLQNVGFQMSFAAVSSILLCQPSFRYCPGIPKAPQQWAWVCLAAQIGVLPITLWYFGTFPTYFLIANLIITPILMPCILYTGLAFLTVTCIMPQWSALLSTPLHILFQILWWIISCIQEWPYAVISL